MKSSLNESDEMLDMANMMVGKHLDSSGFDEANKALYFAIRALKIFKKRDGGWSLSIMKKALHLMGLITCKLKRFDNSLESLNATS